MPALFGEVVLGYAFPGLESVPSLLPLLAVAGSALLAVLLWPIYTLLGLFRKPKGEAPGESAASVEGTQTPASLAGETAAPNLATPNGVGDAGSQSNGQPVNGVRIASKPAALGAPETGSEAAASKS